MSRTPSSPVHFIRWGKDLAPFRIITAGSEKYATRAGSEGKILYWMIFTDGFPYFLKVKENEWNGAYADKQLWAPVSEYGARVAKWLFFKNTEGSIFDVTPTSIDGVQEKICKEMARCFRNPRWRETDPYYRHRRVLYAQRKAGGEFSKYRLGGRADLEQANPRREKELAQLLTKFPVYASTAKLSAADALSTLGADALACARLGWYIGDRTKLGGRVETRTNIGEARVVEMLHRAGFTEYELGKVLRHRRLPIYECYRFSPFVEKRLALLAPYYNTLCKRAQLERAYTSLVCRPTLSELMSVQTGQRASSTAIAPELLNT